MSSSVGADNASPIHAECHRQILNTDIMDNLVIGALKKSRINSHKGAFSGYGQAAGKGDCMLLGDADIKTALGMAAGETR